MKGMKKSTDDFSKLSRTLFIRGLLITVTAAAVVLLFRAVSQGSFAEAIVVWIERTFSMDRCSAYSLYIHLVPANMDIIIGITILVVMLLLFQMLLRSYKKYFEEVIAGIDCILDEDDEKITLRPELEHVGTKLNTVKETLRAREKEARRAEQQKNDLVVYLAHDIKTPLTSVIGYLSLLDENSDLPCERKAKYIHIALEKANRLETLVNEFFEITRYNLQSVPLHRESIDLCYMMVQLSDELYPQMAGRGKRIENHIGENMVIYGDPDKLARVFNNLLKNAIAYGTDNSVISISAEERLGKVMIRLENEGEIPADKLSAVFDKFCRLDSARTSGTGGAGLGLAIAKDIVELHGGTIEASSGHGRTVFTVELPAAANDAS